MTHDQIREMVRKANPVGDPTSLEPVDAPDLTIDEEWRIEMQTEDRPTVTQSGRSRWRGPLVGVTAAVVVLFIGGAVFLLTRDEPAPVAEPAPNATLMTPELDFQPIEPGAYYTDTDKDGPSTVRGTFVIEADDWLGHLSGALKDEGTAETYVALLVVQATYVASPGCDDTEWITAGSTAEELADQFATLPGFVIREGLAPVVAFGQEGYHMVVEIPEEGWVEGSGYTGCAGDGEFDGWSVIPTQDGPPTRDRYYQYPQTLELWFLDVEGTPVLVEATTSPASPEEDVAELRAVLDTLVITP